MKRLCNLVLGLSLALGIYAAPQGKSSYQYTDEKGNFLLLFYYDSDVKTAEVKDVSALVPEGCYAKTSYVIPNTFDIAMGGSSTGGGIDVDAITFDVVGFGAKAFYKSLATSITFPTSGKFAYIRKQGMAEMKNLTGTLILPDGLKEIDEKGLFSGTTGGKMPVTKLVIPASVDSLGKSAVVLNQVKEIEFLGTTPPKVYDDGNGVLPWTISKTSAYNTPKDIKITYPQGADEAYKNAPGISTYFTQLQSGTAIENTKVEASPATKSLYKGMLIIERNGVKYTTTGQRL